MLISKYQDALARLNQEYILLKDEDPMPEPHSVETIENYEADLFEIKLSWDKFRMEESQYKSIPAIFNRSYDENVMSDYLAYIIDPNENGIGIQPLLSLVSNAKGTESAIDLIKRSHRKDIIVHREYCFTDNSRIDILININKQLILGIENKVNAFERSNQTIDYSNAVSEEFPNYESVLFFLTLDKKKASSDNFNAVSYEDLYNRFSELSNQLECGQRQKFLFNEFNYHIQKYFMEKSDLNLSAKTKLHNKYWEMLNDLDEAFTEDYNNLKNYLADNMLALFGDDWEINNREGYIQIYRAYWNKPNDRFIHFEIWDSAIDNLLIDGKLYAMIDVEGKNKQPYLDKFEKIFNSNKSKYISNNVLYKPSSRKNAIGYKEYEYTYWKNPDTKNNIDQIINQMYKDFSFIIPLIDKVLN